MDAKKTAEAIKTLCESLNINTCTTLSYARATLGRLGQEEPVATFEELEEAQDVMQVLALARELAEKVLNPEMQTIEMFHTPGVYDRATKKIVGGSITARIRPWKDKESYFEGVGPSDAEAIGKVICAAGASRFGIEFKIVDNPEG